MRMLFSEQPPLVPVVVRVFDPVNKVPYQFVYGGDNSEITSTAGLETYFNQLGGNKRVFLCKKYQARQCRAQGKCNSIHADRKKVSKLREDNPVSETAAEQIEVDVYSTDENTSYVIPLERIKADAASKEIFRSTGKAVLCSNENCGNECENAHIDCSYLKHVKQMHKAPCCGQAVCNGGEPLPQKYPFLKGVKEIRVFRVGDGDRTSVLPKVMLCVTKGLQQLCDESAQPKSGCVHIPMLRVCRPHFKRACKWGPDCNNIHLCRKRQPRAHTDASSSCSSQEEFEVQMPTSSVDPLLALFRNTAIPQGGMHGY
eukprot:TRINITY_DN634_c0_g1_i1.p1 TRINITY_DN634_c0_g1~~TRINITY_DN634_c0_g1_i1.p1  ORF type:complete len:340 (+),score=46.57 TRINITY_DN634_c0_g1_i1:79-1020(+)